MRDLGEGAFAKVVECVVERDGAQQPCAVKLLKPALFDSNQDVTDFIKEGVVLRKIKHPCAPNPAMKNLPLSQSSSSRRCESGQRRCRRCLITCSSCLQLCLIF